MHKMDHLACYLPGVLALGAAQGAVTGRKASRYKKLAADLTETCFQMYDRQPTGVLIPYNLILPWAPACLVCGV